MVFKMKVFIASHKKYNFSTDKLYSVIQVGALYNDIFSSITDVDGTDNIGHKNFSYCELTAIWWILNNVRDQDFLGLVHYRRYFSKNIRKIHRIFLPPSLDDVLDYNDVKKLTSKYDVILPKKVYVNNSIESHYDENHYSSDYNMMREVITNKYPQYLETFEVVSNGQEYHIGNMFIMKSEYFYECWSWIFDILFEVEKKIDISSYNDYQKRVFGFLSERLFNVWIEKNKNRFNVHYHSICLIENSSRLNQFLRGC